MPMYKYHRRECGEEFEKQVPLSQADSHAACNSGNACKRIAQAVLA